MLGWVNASGVRVSLLRAGQASAIGLARLSQITDTRGGRTPKPCPEDQCKNVFNKCILMPDLYGPRWILFG